MDAAMRLCRLLLLILVPVVLLLFGLMLLENGMDPAVSVGDPGPVGPDAAAPVLTAGGSRRIPAPLSPAQRFRRWRRLLPRDAPADPVQRGDCVLELHLASDQDGAPVDTPVQLWRIGEAANAEWTAGDRLIDSLATEGGRAVKDSLAPGRYQVSTAAQRKGSQDSDPFEVGGARTIVHIMLAMPRTFPVYLRVYGRTGEMLYAGWNRFTGGRAKTRRMSTSRWVRRRRLQGMRYGGGVFVSRRGRVGSPDRGASELRVQITGGVPGFKISRHPEASRTEDWSESWEVGSRTHGTVLLRVNGGCGGERTYVAPAVALRDLHDAVFLPDGRRAIDAGAEFQALADARIVPESGDEPDWRQMPIDVIVRLKGYRRILRRHRLGNTMPRMVMEKR